MPISKIPASKIPIATTKAKKAPKKDDKNETKKSSKNNRVTTTESSNTKKTVTRSSTKPSSVSKTVLQKRTTVQNEKKQNESDKKSNTNNSKAKKPTIRSSTSTAPAISNRTNQKDSVTTKKTPITAKKAATTTATAKATRIAGKTMSVDNTIRSSTSTIPAISKRTNQKNSATAKKAPTAAAKATRIAGKTMSVDDTITNIKKAATRKTINSIVSKFKQSLPDTLSPIQREQLEKVKQAESERAVSLCCYNILVGCKMIIPNKNQTLTGFEYSQDAKQHDFLYALDVFLFGSDTKQPTAKKSIVAPLKNGGFILRNIDNEKKRFTDQGISKNTKISAGIEVAKKTSKPIKNKEGTRNLNKEQAQKALDHLIKNSSSMSTGKESYTLDDYKLAMVSLNTFLKAKEKATETTAKPVDIEVLGQQLQIDIARAVEEAARAKAVKETVAGLVDKTVRVEEEQTALKPTLIKAETVRTKAQFQTASTETLKKATKQVASTDFKKATKEIKANKLAAEKHAKLETSDPIKAVKQEICDMLGVENADFSVDKIDDWLHRRAFNIIGSDHTKMIIMECIIADIKSKMKKPISEADKLKNGSELCQVCIAAAHYIEEKVSRESVQAALLPKIGYADKIGADIIKHIVTTLDTTNLVYSSEDKSDAPVPVWDSYYIAPKNKKST